MRSVTASSQNEPYPTSPCPHGQLAIFPGSAHGTYLGVAEGTKPGNRQPELAAAMTEAFLDEP